MPAPERPLELDADTMRGLGYRVVDVLVDRIASLDAQPAWRGANRAALEARLREPAPESAAAFDDLRER